MFRVLGFHWFFIGFLLGFHRTQRCVCVLGVGFSLGFHWAQPCVF